MNGMRLALKYIAYNKLKSLILVACLFLTALLPIAIKILLWQFDQKLLQRSKNTPVVIGAPGSRLDLSLHAMNFRTQSPGTIPFSESGNLHELPEIRSVAIYSEFTARDFPVVGTTVDYFAFRNLSFQSGDPFAILGECVIGTTVADRLQLEPGDSILTDRENLVDIAGQYPLKLNVSGVLTQSGSADDAAIFVDLKTAWVIKGLGHGHQDLESEQDSGKVLERTENEIVASAAVLPYLEITPGNIDSFHFHGDPETFPLTAIIVAPETPKSGTLLEGHFQQSAGELQFVRPPEVIRELMNLLFRVKAFFDFNTVLIAISTALLMALVVGLSLRLREREMETMFKVGCSRGTIARIQFWELALIFFVSTVLVGIAVSVILRFGHQWIERLFLA